MGHLTGQCIYFNSFASQTSLFPLNHTATCAGCFDAHTCLLDFSVCSIAKGPAEAGHPFPKVSTALDGKVRDEDEVTEGRSGKLGPGLGARLYSNMWEAEDGADEGRVSRWRSQGIYLQTCNSGSLTEQPGPAIVHCPPTRTQSHGGPGAAGTHGLSVHS